MDALSRLNAASDEEARDALRRCCGASRWVAAMAERRPFRDAESLYAAADEVWKGLGPADWREAFAHHPRIGDRGALRSRSASTRQWAKGEQAGVDAASEDVLEALARGNRDYEARFGHIFVVCATGKSAPEMLSLLRERLRNEPEREARIAAGEQAKITRLRLEKLLQP
jgi:2-oxo-4-hydroxy-4-carboxy-5-ureidoimidazoline decarboxylase